MTNPIGVAMRIKMIRQSKKMTQVQVAERAGMSQSYFTEIEMGKKRPNMARYESIAQALEVSLDELLGQDQPPASTDLSRRIGALSLSDQAVILRVLEGLEASNRGRDGMAT
jgi:transcriptional regulator with XRE-family HTH domain